MEVFRMKEFELEELRHFDGKENRPAYVAYKGKVYDVSGSNRWKAGLHMNRHHAGKDLTTDIQAAPHEPSVLEKYPLVGTVEKNEGAERDLPPALSWLLTRAPFLRRHPHPMTIHFPIAFTFAALLFNVLYLLLGTRAFEITALHCLGAAIFFTPVAIVTGFYTWWLNYQAKRIRPVRIKQRLSFILLAVEIIVFVWRLKNAAILDFLGWQSILYFLLILFIFILVSVIGWFGANLTFPIEKPITRDQ
jgi:predicted heme/steroid binding protein/uncharacterized membrane protein